MPNTLYRYSKGTGVIKKDYDNITPQDRGNWHDSPDMSMISYLKRHRVLCLESIENLKASIKEKEKDLDHINKELAPFKEKYPEEFI